MVFEQSFKNLHHESISHSVPVQLRVGEGKTFKDFWLNGPHNCLVHRRQTARLLREFRVKVACRLLPFLYGRKRELAPPTDGTTE